jgi:peptide/nickel transport system substrate-binding protein
MKRLVVALLIVVGFVGHALAQPRSAPAKPEGEMRWALYATLAPAWFDPGEVTAGFLTPFWILYAMHDALVKPMPGNLMAPSLAESWTLSPDQRMYELLIDPYPWAAPLEDVRLKAR